MEDVTGFNQKSSEYDGERLIAAGLARLRQRYSEPIIDVLRHLLKFNENDRPSFIDLAKLIASKKFGASA